MFGLASQIGAMLLALAAPGTEDGDQLPSAPAGTAGSAPMSYAPTSDSQTLQPLGQVRVEGRITIRVRPRSGDQRLLSSLPSRPMSREMKTVPMAKCVRMADLVGVQVARDNRLLIFLRDRRIVLAALERACSARDYYSGFYIEPADDKQLCVDRDVLHSRAGAKCKLASWEGLVVADD